MFLYNKKNKFWVYKSFLAFLKKIAPVLLKRLLFNRNSDALIKVSRFGVLPAIAILKNHLLFQYRVLIDLIVYDTPGTRLRFTVLYLLLSEVCNSRLTVCTYSSEVLGLNSVVSLYKAAGWFEREAWDLFGLFFINHPDLRRVLTDYGFINHPLRKDFPLMGYKEVFFNEKKKRIVYNSVDSKQSFRVFYFNSRKLAL